MGSHWSHWTAKSLLCALAVSNGGSCQLYPPRGKSENLSSNEFYALLHRRSFRITYERPNEHFPIYLLGNTINVCWNCQNRVCFSMRWSIWGVTCLGLIEKWTCFPIYLLRNPMDKCVETLRTGLVFPRRSIWGVTWLGLLYVSPWKQPWNVCWNHQNRVRFSEMINLRVTCLGLVEKWMFSHLSP